MKLVVVESPYAGNVAGNVAYAKRCVVDCLKRGEAPYASHLFFTQPGLLDDRVPAERELGMAAGFAWGRLADVVAFYVDRGWSSGMRRGLREVLANPRNDIEIEIRCLDREITRDDYLELLK